MLRRMASSQPRSRKRPPRAWKDVLQPQKLLPSAPRKAADDLSQNGTFILAPSFFRSFLLLSLAPSLFLSLCVCVFLSSSPPSSEKQPPSRSYTLVHACACQRVGKDACGRRETVLGNAVPSVQMFAEPMPRASGVSFDAKQICRQLPTTNTV